jgi:bile acid:Na+ symporter, BASS family
MKQAHPVFKILLVLATMSLVAFAVTHFFLPELASGSYLIAFFVLLAVGLQGFEKLRSFSYTVWIFAAVTVSMYFPEFFQKAGNFELKRLIVPLLQIIMFGMGSQMSLADFRGVISMPKAVFVGLLAQYSIMPFIGVTIATQFGFPPEIAAGVVLVGVSPSGLASNVMSFIAKANLALAVTLAAFGTLLAPLLTPALMKLLAGQFIAVNFWSMMLDTMNMIILPIVAGLIFNMFAYGKKSRKEIIVQLLAYLGIIFLHALIMFTTSDTDGGKTGQVLMKNMFWFILLPAIAGGVLKSLAKGNYAWLSNFLSLLSMVGIAVIITIITAAGRDSLLEVGLLLVVACLLHNLTGYLLGYWMSRLFGLSQKDSRTVAFEVGMQNGGLASGLALQMGKVATVGLAPAIFGPLMNITGSILATWWRGRPAEEHLKIGVLIGNGWLPGEYLINEAINMGAFSKRPKSIKVIEGPSQMDKMVASFIFLEASKAKDFDEIKGTVLTHSFNMDSGRVLWAVWAE